MFKLPEKNRVTTFVSLLIWLLLSCHALGANTGKGYGCLWKDGGLIITYDGSVLLDSVMIQVSQGESGPSVPLDSRACSVALQAPDLAKGELLRMEFASPADPPSPGSTRASTEPSRITLSAVIPKSPANRVIIKLDAPKPLKEPLTVEFAGQLHWGAVPLLSRLTPGAGRNVVQTSLGPLESARCDSIFDASTDKAVTFSGSGAVELPRSKGGYAVTSAVHVKADTADAELLTINITDDVYRKGLGIKYYSPIDKSVFPLPPSGWCSWYYYYQNLRERDVKANADWMAKNLKPYGAEYIQVDDSWQGVGHGSGDNRDWETVDRRFSGGMKELSDYIHSLGMKSGLWLAPHGQSDDFFTATNADAFLWKKDGTSVGFTIDSRTGQPKDINWEGKYIVDTSGPAGQNYMKRLFGRLAGEWGYDYFKIDGQPIVEDLYKNYRSQLDDRAPDPLDSYRAGIQAIRETIGPERYLLGCWGTPLSGIGIMNGSRTGGDIKADWEGFMPALDATLNSYFLHNIVWYNDPDVLCVRSPLSINQARAWASLFGLTGQALMASDNMPALPRNRVEILKKVFPAADIRPVDLYPYGKEVDTWDLRVSKGGGTWDVVGLFNWGQSPKTMDLNPDSLGIRGKGGPYRLFDFWEQKYLGERRGTVRFVLPPTSCKVIAVRQAADHPQVVSTSRHITQGWLDLKETNWDPGSNVLSGESEVVGGDDYSIAVALPTGSTAYTPRKVEVAGGESEWHSEGGLLTLKIKRNTSGSVKWRICFKVGASQPQTNQRPQIPGDFKAVYDPKGEVMLTWSGDAPSYRIYRNSRLLGEVASTEFADGNLAPGGKYSYKVAAVNLGGDEGEPTDGIEIATGPARDVYLSDIKILNAAQEWGSLRRDRSVDGNPLKIEGVTYEKGLGSHAKSSIKVSLGQAYREFRAVAGIDDEVSSQGSAVFKVYVDGREVWNSGLLRGKDKGKQVAIDLTGAEELALETDSGPDNNNYDHTDWASARLLAVSQ